MALQAGYRPRKWVLRIIVLLLVSSGVLRLTGETGAVLAKEMADIGREAPGAPDAEPMICPPGSEIAEMMMEIKARDSALVSRKAELEELESKLAAARVEIESKIEVMVETETALAATMAMANSAAENDLLQLTTLYESMKPQDAAVLFAEMDPEFSSGFLARMRPEAAAAIMAGLEPQTAYAISVILAGRNAEVPTNSIITQ